MWRGPAHTTHPAQGHCSRASAEPGFIRKRRLQQSGLKQPPSFLPSLIPGQAQHISQEVAPKAEGGGFSDTATQQGFPSWTTLLPPESPRSGPAPSGIHPREHLGQVFSLPPPLGIASREILSGPSPLQGSSSRYSTQLCWTFMVIPKVPEGQVFFQHHSPYIAEGLLQARHA